jgi:hypothetical protein
MVTCKAPTGSGTGHSLTIYVDEQPNLVPAVLNYPIPQLTSVTSVNTDGGQITITGANFFPGENIVTIGSSVNCATVTETYNVITCTMPPGTGANYQVTVTTDGQPSEDDVIFSYNRKLF